MKTCIIHYDLPKTNWYADILKNFTYGSLSKFNINYDLIFNGDKFPNLKNGDYDLIDMSEWCNPWHEEVAHVCTDPIIVTTAEVSLTSLKGYFERNNIDVQFLKSRVKHFIARSSWTRDMLIQFGISEKNIDVIHYGANLNKFCPDNDINKEYSFLYVGSINRNKGIHHLINAYLKIMDKTDWKLKLCIGEFNNDRDLLDHVAYLANIYKNNIQLVPFPGIDKLSDIYHTATCFCHIQDYDCPAQCSNPSIWALCCGLPLISLDIGVFRDYIENDKNGFLFKKIEDLSSKMLEMTERDWKTMGKISRKIAERDHSSENIATKYRDIYNKVIE